MTKQKQTSISRILRHLGLYWRERFSSISPDLSTTRGLLKRWYLVPDNRWFNIYLHSVRGTDNDPPHDHPWPFLTMMLLGSYREERYWWDNSGYYGGYASDPDSGHREWRRCKQGSIVFRSATAAHRISVPARKVCWTLVITGPVVRKWGFWIDDRWVEAGASGLLTEE